MSVGWRGALGGRGTLGSLGPGAGSSQGWPRLSEVKGELRAPGKLDVNAKMRPTSTVHPSSVQILVLTQPLPLPLGNGQLWRADGESSLTSAGSVTLRKTTHGVHVEITKELRER